MNTLSLTSGTLKTAKICRKAIVCTWVTFFAVAGIALIDNNHTLPDIIFAAIVSLAIASVLFFLVHLISFTVLFIEGLNQLSNNEVVCYIIADLAYIAIISFCCWLPFSFYW